MGGGRSGIRAGGGAVALTVELLSADVAEKRLLVVASLSSYRFGNEVRAWRYTEALAALRQVVVANEGDGPSDVGLHSSRIGAATIAGDRGQGVAEDHPERR